MVEEKHLLEQGHAVLVKTLLKQAVILAVNNS